MTTRASDEKDLYAPFCNSSLALSLLREDIVKTKQCTKCGEVLPASEFDKASDKKDGLRSHCKCCMYIYGKNYYMANKEKVNNRYKIWSTTNRDIMAKRDKQYRTNNIEKARAKSHIAYLISAGKITRPSTCSSCGKLCKPDGHHFDYDKPSKVIWLCRSCHKSTHRQITREESMK